MTDTPETDAAVIAAGGDWSPVLRAVAQRLERERNGARELAEAFHRDQVTLLLERDEARAERDILRLDAQSEAEHHDRMVGEIEKVYRERDEAREAFVIATDQMVIAQGKVREANKERDEARRIITSALAALPVGYIPAHTADTIPSRIADLCKAISELERERDEAQKLLKQIGNPTNPL